MQLSIFSLSRISRNSLLTSYFTACSEFHERFRFKSRMREDRISWEFDHEDDGGSLPLFQHYSKTLQTILYPNRAHVFLLGRPAVSTKLPIYPLRDVPGALRGRYDVKRRRDGSTLLEIADPEFAPRKFPLDVGAFLITSTPNCPAN